MANDSNSIMDTLQSLLSNIPQDKIESIIGMASGNSDDKPMSDNAVLEPEIARSAPEFNQSDVMTKITSIYQQLTDRSNPRASLLLSLKPYLKKNKHASVDMAINLLNLGSVIPVANIFKTNSNKNDNSE